MNRSVDSRRTLPPVRLAVAGALALSLATACAGRQGQLVTEPATEIGAAAPVELPPARDAADEAPARWTFPEIPTAEADFATLEPWTVQTAPGEDPVTPSPLDELGEVTPQLSPEELERERGLVSSSAPSFDIPVPTNDRVLAWVDLYSGNLKTSFEAGLKRSGRYLELFREIFAEQGLPQDLVYMAAVESGYKTSAYSRAHARGIFQFIAATARRYGLRVDYWVDERADPEKAARAAAAYVRDLYDEFGDWHLALAAYNAGEGKVRRAMKRTGKRDFWELAQTRYLRRETRNHVPAVLAATILSKQPEQYGLHHDPDPPLAYDTIQVEGAADLRVIARCAGTDLETLKQLNPALRRWQTPPDGHTDVHVPAGRGEQTVVELTAVPLSERVLYQRYRVRRGDTLSTIARRHGVAVRAIQDANGLGRSTLIRENQVLRIPTPSAGRYEPVEASADASLVTYRVRRGDTLSGIARRYGTSAAAIAAASGISVHEVLQVGQSLRVVEGVRSPTAAAELANGRRASSGGSVNGHANGHEATGTRTHVVRRGDTLWGIARRYRTSVEKICGLNAISPSTVLRPGVKLTVGY